MGSTVDLKTVDFYELLAIPAQATEAEIRRGYRKTSLLYHPDKVKPTPETLEKFQLLQQAINTLTDPAEKAKYDQQREAKLRRKAENAALDARRRKMVDDLEKRENGVQVNGAANKRSWTQRDLDIKRIAEENRKKREKASLKKAQEAHARAPEDTAVTANQQNNELDRSAKVKWIKEGEGLAIDQAELEATFPAGDVESVVMLKDKKRRLDGRDKKVAVGTAFIVFTTLKAAKKAVAAGPWEGIESISSAAERENEPT